MYRITTSLFSLLLTSLIFTRCNRGKDVFTSPPGYDMEKPFQLKLPLELDEISGLAYYPKDSSVFAINDEKGWLYKLGLGRNRSMIRWKFSSGADFEDLALLDSTFFVLQSSGTVIRIDIKSGVFVTREIPFPYGKGNEFEILYYDDQRKKLILICKDCETDKKKSLTTFSFDPLTDRFSDSSFTIDVNPIAAAMEKKSVRFKPSAAAINPIDSMLYIVSAINKLIVVTDRNGIFKKAYTIDPSLFKQPEGITFTPWGAIIISKEAANVGVADILIFSPGKTKNPS
jgi:uncharacterized protein YjiK